MHDFDIARKTKLRPIAEVGRRLNIPSGYLEPCGKFKAKVSPDLLTKAVFGRRTGRGKYIVVTGITPTHLGEGKTVTTIGLAMALNRAGDKSVACLRQPSLGPFFGIKGAGVGGGYSQIHPADDISINFTGDIHAVGQAHNLAAAFLDNRLFRGNSLDIDKNWIFWRRVVDTNDRSLRHIEICVDGPARNGMTRRTGFDITAASEIMAILSLSESLADLRKRIGRTVVALTKSGKPITCEDLKVAGAMTAVLREALKPNLVQTSENTPCFVHTGPFANITHGNSSILADRMALGLADYTVTESGFGADCGFEKFMDIKCRQSRLAPDAAVLVLSIRALKAHSGMFKISAGRALDKTIEKENVDAVEAGCANLEKQIENVRIFGVPCVVAINRFVTDTDREIAVVRRSALDSGAFDCVESHVYRNGSKGGRELASAVVAAASCRAKTRFLYPLDTPIKTKIETIAKKIYGAKSVHYGPVAEEHIALYTKLGYTKLPVCMAKTHLSLSHDPNLKGRPEGFDLYVRDLRPSIGAGFLYALCGKTVTMPGLPTHPAGERIDIDSKGRLRICT